MDRNSRTRWLDIFFDNPKSNTQNRKWLGRLVMAFVLVVAGAVAEAQQAKKVFPMGYLSGTTRAVDAPQSEAIRLALRGFGYIERQNISIEYRHAEGKPDRLPELAAELVRLKVAVIVIAGGNRTIRAAMNATKTIPIVMIGSGSDPVEAGFIESLAHPGGNVTGLTNLATELGGKRLEILKEAIGKVTRVAVLYDPSTPGQVRELKDEIPPAARALKLTIQPWEVRAEEDFGRVFAALSKQRPDGLYAPTGGSLTRVNAKRVVDFALKSRLPSMFSRGEIVEAGGLMYYGADSAERYRQVAWYVDKILTGRTPADLPVQQPMRFEFVVNQQTADKIGVTIDPNVLARATKIIR